MVLFILKSSSVPLVKGNLEVHDETLLVVDLEATCWKHRTTPDGEPQGVHNMEIIEFGCALATRAGKLLDSRSFLVRPTRFPELSDFCTELTSISQSMVDDEPSYREIIDALDQWLGQPSEDFIWCSWGNYDRLHVLAESQKHGHTPRFMAYPHLNLKRIWRRTTGQKKKNGLAHALAFHNLDFEGRHHRGVDDARNIVRLLPFMDWSLETELVTHPGIKHLKGSVSSERIISLDAMDEATRAKARRLNMLGKPRRPNPETARVTRELGER
ncbi:MAG: Inhibitor of the KinA pathway to sporulation, predicted exonuclease [Marinobacter sp. HL-58]|nr:MAG: Inhibitor of the KinA pathway to sporulation, predicted exonuclease [Marinobacter sp. HL-58]